MKFNFLYIGSSVRKRRSPNVLLKQDLLTANNNTINSLVEKFKDGKLTIAEFITLIKSLLDERYQVGRLSAIRDLINGIIPDGWEADLCLNCNKPVNGVMMDAARTTRIMVSDRSRPLTHSSWSQSCSL
jgi:hypothetical protein